jgi:hypothetical protein
MTVAELPTTTETLPLNITLDYYRSISTDTEYNDIIEVLKDKLSYRDAKPL